MRRPLRIDIHTHILPEDLPDLCERYGDERWVRLERHAPCQARMIVEGEGARELAANAWEPAVRLEECDDAAVDVQVLSTVPILFSYWAPAEQALDLARRLNDHIAGVCRDHPDRFAGLGTLPMQDPTLAIGELERCMGELGLAGIEIGTHIDGRNLYEPAVFDVLVAAEDLGAAVFVHPWDMMGQDQMSRYWLPWLVGMPAEVSRAICSVIFGGVLERLPQLRIAFAHGGGAFPSTIGRIEHGFRVRPDLCAVDNDVNPRDYLGRFYVDSLVHDPDVLRYVMSVIGEDRVALGSDYPFVLGEAEPGRMIDSMDLPEQTRHRLLGGTALEFLDLPAERFERR